MKIKNLLIEYYKNGLCCLTDDLRHYISTNKKMVKDYEIKYDLNGIIVDKRLLFKSRRDLIRVMKKFYILKKKSFNKYEVLDERT